MSNKKQSSIEWLVDYIKNLEKYPYKTIQELEEKAKAMHKDEVVQTFEKAYLCGYKDNGNRGIEYYNETFGGSHE